MFTRYYTEGIVLSELVAGEADKIFVVYTREFGKIDLRGRSIRKGNSKLGMNFQLFSYVNIGFVQGKNYKTITDVFSICSFKGAKKNLGKLSLFYRISESMLSLIKGEEKDERIFAFLLSAFKKIEKTNLSRKEIELFYCFFSFQLLRLLGYEPRLRNCAICRKEIEKDCYFDSKKGGVTCRECFKKESLGVYLEDVRALSFFFRLDVKDFPQDAKTPVCALNQFLSIVSENPYFKK